MNKLNLVLNQIKFDHEEEKQEESHSQRISATAPKGGRFSQSYGVYKDSRLRSGHHSVDNNNAMA